YQGRNNSAEIVEDTKQIQNCRVACSCLPRFHGYSLVSPAKHPNLLTAIPAMFRITTDGASCIE
ncbi:hypothetical protein BGX34_006936, partial [Mortierella sp. NVP85]